MRFSVRKNGAKRTNTARTDKTTAARPSSDGKWRSSNRVPHLQQYLNSGTYFASVKIKETIRAPLSLGRF